MTLPVVWLPEADAELKQALAHYDAIRPELGARFIQAVEETIEAVASAPLRFAVVEDIEGEVAILPGDAVHVTWSLMQS